MARNMRFDVTYRDGREESYPVLPIHLLDLEEEAGDAVTASLKNGYRLAHLASESPLPFRDWVATTETIETVNPDAPEGAEAVTEGGDPVPTVTP